jgi:tetratricopeptide (TPR) repeat protein
MSGYDDSAPRRVVPRWRDSKIVRGIAEDIPVPSRFPPRVTAKSKESLDKKLEIWRSDPSIGMAADVVGAAFLSGRFDSARDAAKYLLESRAAIPLELVSLAQLILGRQELDARQAIATSPRDEIRKARKRLHDHFENPILLVDTARHFSALGQNDKALRFVNTALHLAPNHRFVLRAATRLLVHLDDPDAALRFLRRAASTPGDPWLVSAEISVAAVAGKKSTLLSRGSAILKEGRFPPSQITELASAVATSELSHGKNRVAKRLFADSLVAPNDNAIAQVEWANRRERLGFDVDQKVREVPFTFEAQFWVNYEHRDEARSKQLVREWAIDEPFSSRPVVMGTFLGGIYGDYQLGLELGEAGLIANPDDEQIVNNLAFIEASQGNLVGAWQRIHRSTNYKSPHFVANTGLIAYRKGEIALGRQCYRAAIKLSKLARQPQTEALATLFFAREALLAGDPQSAKIAEAAARFAKNQETTSVKVLWERLRPQIESGQRQKEPKAHVKIESFDDAEVKVQIGKIISDE